MPSTGPEHDYAIQMARLHRGYALFDPYPGQRSDGVGGFVRKPRVEIGDVGYIARGSFRFLFNIHRQANDPLQINGVPPDFVPLERREEHIDRRLGNCPSVIHSDASVGVDIGSQFSTPAAGGFSLQFNRERERCAALAYFDQHEIWDAQNKKAYSRYYRTHWKHWIAFVKSQDLDITIQDVILVTGCERTRAWATLWNEASSTSGAATLDVQTGIGVSASLTASIRWSDTHGVSSKCGPPPHELASSTRASLTAMRETIDTAPDTTNEDGFIAQSITALLDDTDNAEASADQCIFLRGYHAHAVPLLAPKQLKAAAGPHRLPRRDSYDEDDASPQIPVGFAAAAVTDLNCPRCPSDAVSFCEPLTSCVVILELQDETIVSIALELVADHFTPSCESEILIMHDDELLPYVPNVGDTECNLWNCVEDVREHLKECFQISPPDCIAWSGSCWEQRAEDHGSIFQQDIIPEELHLDAMLAQTSARSRSSASLQGTAPGHISETGTLGASRPLPHGAYTDFGLTASNNGMVDTHSLLPTHFVPGEEPQDSPWSQFSLCLRICQYVYSCFARIPYAWLECICMIFIISSAVASACFVISFRLKEETSLRLEEEWRMAFYFCFFLLILPLSFFGADTNAEANTDADADMSGSYIPTYSAVMGPSVVRAWPQISALWAVSVTISLSLLHWLSLTSPGYAVVTGIGMIVTIIVAWCVRPWLRY